jgi:hypothetical protein
MAVTESAARRVDQSAIKVNQAFIAGLLLMAFILNSWPLAALVALVMLVGTAVPAIALFQAIYRKVLRPLGVVRAKVIADNPEPHRFAQGFGGVVVALGVVAIVVGAWAPGWALVWLVIALASANLLLGFCAGCFMYYQLNRLGMPGFRYSRPQRG